MSVSDTSVDAYNEHKESGKLGKQAMSIMAGLEPNKDYSRREISKLLKMELSSVCGRVNELLAAGLMLELETRKCLVTGKTIHPVKVRKDV